MSQGEVEQFIGRLITDDTFREWARHDLRSACRENGFALTDDELELVQQINLDAFSPLAELLADGIRRCERFRSSFLRHHAGKRPGEEQPF
jgi:hypothetical protein